MKRSPKRSCPHLSAAGNGRMRANVTQHADEEGLVDQFVALRIQQVELEGQAASLLPFLMAVVQQACRTAGILEYRCAKY